MAQSQADPNAPLSDEYLQAHANDPQVAPYFSSEERRRLSRIGSGPRPSVVSNEEPGTYWGGFLQSLKDQVREVGTGLKPMLESAAHPETVADFAQLLMPNGALGAAKAAGPVTEGVSAARTALSAPAEAFITRKLGLDPAAIELQATRMRLQAAKSRTRQAQMAARMPSEGAPATTPATAPPNARIPDVSPAPSPSQVPAARPSSPVAAPVARSLPPEDPAVAEIVDRMAGGPDQPSPGNGTFRPKSPRQTFDLKSMTPDEQTQAAKWLAENVPADVIVARIKASRKFTGAMKTPNPEEAARVTATRVADAAKRRKSGLADEEP